MKAETEFGYEPSLLVYMERHQRLLGDKAAVSGNVRCRIDRRYVVPVRRRYERRAKESTPQDDKAASRLAPKGDDGRFDLYVVLNGRYD
jgi:hypothetical protein